VTVLLLALLGLGVGTFGTLVGAGGGFILTPILLLLYPGEPAKVLTAISLTVVFFNAASGSIAYARQRRIDYASGWRFAMATLPGSVAGALVVQYAPRRVFDLIMAALLTGLGLWLVIWASRARLPGGRLVRRRLADRAGMVFNYRVALYRGIAYSLAIGFLSSFLGIGGGPFNVPVLFGLLGFPIHVATATSQFILMFMSATGVVTHVVEGSFLHAMEIRRALSLSAGVVVGAQIGAFVSRRTSGSTIQRLLALGLLAIAARLFASA
jgi:uncharacterized membrane protein YfcA